MASFVSSSLKAGVAEVRRNLAAKLPEGVPLFEEFLRAVPTQIHRPTAHDRERARELADAKDVPDPRRSDRRRSACPRDAQHLHTSEGVRVVRPRTLIEEARAWLGSFGI